MECRVSFAHACFEADLRPARPGGVNFFVERDQAFLARGRTDKSRDHPADRGERHGIKHRVRERLGVARFLHHKEHDGDDERTDHRHHFARGVDAPPEPAQQIEQPRARANGDQNLKRILRRVQHQTQQRGHDVEQQRADAAHVDVVLLRCTGRNETPVKIVDEIGRSPVEMCQDGGGTGRDESADHQADETHREKFQHRRERAVVADEVRVGIGKRGLNVFEFGEDDDRTQSRDDPRPRAQHVVGKVEEQRRTQGILLRLRRQHALGDVAAAARFSAGIPVGPPADGDGHDENHQRQFAHREVRKDVEDGLAVTVNGRQNGLRALHVDLLRAERADQLLQSGPGALAHAGMHGHRLQTEIRRRHDRRHLDEELNHVYDQHAPQTRVRGEDHVEHAAKNDRLPRRHPEKDVGDLAARQRHHAHDETVEEQPEIDRAKSAHQRSRFS